jgi:hypothetical protein
MLVHLAWFVVGAAVGAGLLIGFLAGQSQLMEFEAKSRAIHKQKQTDENNTESEMLNDKQKAEHMIATSPLVNAVFFACDGYEVFVKKMNDFAKEQAHRTSDTAIN